jgi:hypothetical protein
VDIDPNAPVITALVGQPVNGGTVELKGTGEVGETIKLFADGGATVVGTGVVAANGTFDITTTASFVDGIHTFTATETDTASLTSTASTPAFSVNVDPNAPVIATLVGQPVAGGTVELTGTGQAGDTIKLFADGNTATAVGTGVVAANGTFVITTTATFANGVHTFTATETDATNLTSAASSPPYSVSTTFGSVLSGNANLGPVQVSLNTGSFNGFFQPVASVQDAVEVTLFNGAEGNGHSLHIVHADIEVAFESDGSIDFSAPLGALAASLDGDLVSARAMLPDGRPLPNWLHFDASNGEFAGLVPDGVATSTVPSDGGLTTAPAKPHSALPEKITIEVIGRDSKGDISIIQFTINLKPKGDHTWNDPDLRNVLPAERAHHAASHLHLVPLPERTTEALPNMRADIGIVHAPAGRAGLSAQLDGMGWRGMQANRLALLESLKHASGAMN